jgi:hypothetical protein
MQRTYQVNGQNVAYDNDAHAWFSAFLPRILAQSGVNAGPRVARWRAQGGVQNVLRNIEAIGSSGAMRAHYEALLSSRLSDDELENVFRSVTENMRGSSGDLRGVLSRLAPVVRVSKRNAPALENALNAIASSGDKSAVLMLFGETSDHDVLALVMRVAETVASSGDKTRVLQSLAARYLTSNDAALENAWFDVARDVPSSGDLRRALQTAVTLNPRTGNVTRQIISASNSVASSGDRSAVLISLVNSGAVNTRELRDAFMRAAEGVPSDGDRGRVLMAAVRAGQ